MSQYFPQACVQLEVLWENHGSTSPVLAKVYNTVTLAKKITVNINDYSQADTFKIELDYKCFPFDPRNIRSIGVTVYIEDMRALVGADGLEKRISRSEENVIFMGFADEDNIDLNDSSRTVTFEGRDYTALFLDDPYLKGTINLTKPVDQVIQDIVNDRLSTRKIRIEKRPANMDTSKLTIGKYYPDFSLVPQTGNKKNVKRHETYWDVITDLVDRAGLIAFIELDRLVIMRPRNLYEGAIPYQFVYGRNVKSMKISRKLSKQKGFNVLVRSIDPENQQVVTADIPFEATDAWLKDKGLKREQIKIKRPVASGTRADTSGLPPDEHVAPHITFSLPDLGKPALIEKGQAVFEELSRQQIQGSLETNEMRILQQQGEDQNYVEFNILKIRNGTPVAVSLAEDDLEQLVSMPTGSVEKKRTYLIARGYSEEFANAWVATQGRFQTLFYTRGVEFSQDDARGFAMKLDFINFIDLKAKGL